MKRVALVVGVFALSSGSRPAAAEGSYVKGLVGPSLAYGGHTGSGSDAILGAAGAFGAVRFPLGGHFAHVGIVGDIRFSRTFAHDYALQAAPYFQHDFASLWLDPQLGVSVFYRLEPGFRYDPGNANAAFAGYVMLGLNALGFSIALAGGAEVALGPGVTNRGGWVGETRLALDVVEIVTFCIRLHTHQPLP